MYVDSSQGEQFYFLKSLFTEYTESILEYTDVYNTMLNSTFLAMFFLHNITRSCIFLVQH